MLKTLRRIIQDVNSAGNLTESLELVVRHVRAAMETNACSIFLFDDTRAQHVLMATDGLNEHAVGKIRVGIDDSLVGYVGKRGEPVNLANARAHECFLMVPTVGEDDYHSFLGVPIIHNRKLLGVIIVQQEEARRFDEAEEAFLVTLAAQLGSVIAQAEASGMMTEIEANEATRGEMALTGIGSSPGVGVGTMIVVYPPSDLEAVPEREVDNIDNEILSFEKALEATRLEVLALCERISLNLSDSEKTLFDAYLRILESASFKQAVVDQIHQGQWAQRALADVVRHHVRQFVMMEDEYLQERAADIRDLGRRVLANLQQVQHRPKEYPMETILVGDEVTAAALAEVPEDRLKAVVSRRGSSNSHVAIIARALNIPTVTGVENLPVTRLEGTEAVVDGYYGHVYLAPSKTLRQEYLVLLQEEKELDADLQQLRDLPAETTDHCRIRLLVNAGLMTDVGRSLGVGAEGVGLYRTEVSFMVRDRFPSEEEQRVLYRQLLGVFAPRSVTMRTLDVGGDKPLSYFPIEEANPYLGWRGIRMTLDHPEVFLVQIRAMLRASEGLNNLSLLLPMISNISEVKEAKRLIQQAYDELQEEGYTITMPPIGAMVEVPSIVYQMKELAARVDFLSIGSNDLTQYLLAVDRNNPRVANLYDSLHPAVLKAILEVMAVAKEAGKKVSLCGEMAGDPAAVLLLMGMGFDSLSLAAANLPRIKWVIRQFSRSESEALLQEVLTFYDPRAIRAHLELALERAGLGGLIRAGK